MYTLKRYDWTLHLATIAVCSYFLAQTVTTYIGGILESLPEGTELKGEAGIRPLAAPAGEEQAPELDSYQLIAERNIFNSAQTGAAAEVPAGEMSAEQMGELGPAAKTSLDIKVLGTL